MTRTRALLATVLAAAVCSTTSCALFSEASGTTPPPATPPSSTSPMTPSPSSTAAPTSSPSTTPSPKPTSKTDEVTTAVSKYHRVLDELGQKPPRDPYKKLFTVTRDEEFDMWQDVMIQQSFAGERQVGGTKVMFVKHGKITKKDGQRRVVAEVCVDVSGVDMLDKKGKSVISKDRPDRAAEKLWMVAEDGSWYVYKSRDGSWKC